jgi:hypothetical protein
VIVKPAQVEAKALVVNGIIPSQFFTGSYATLRYEKAHSGWKRNSALIPQIELYQRLSGFHRHQR